jgi:uncharacterized membrane protein
VEGSPHDYSPPPAASTRQPTRAAAVLVVEDDSAVRTLLTEVWQLAKARYEWSALSVRDRSRIGRVKGSTSAANDPGFSKVLARNIDALVAARREDERRRRLQDRVSDVVTRFTGSMRFVVIHALLFGGWIVWNLEWLKFLPAFDPSFVVLAMVASVEAIFLSTFVLISQNRMQATAEKRADLDVQISLLAEHEVTQMMTLLDAVARHLGVQTEQRSEIEQAKHDVDPSTVLDAISERQDGDGRNQAKPR